MYTVFRPYLKEYNPQTAKHRAGEHFSKVHTRELSKRYPDYFTLTPKAKRALATRLGMTVESLRKWMSRKWQKEDLERKKQKLQTSYMQEHGISFAGMLQVPFTYGYNPNSIQTAFILISLHGFNSHSKGFYILFILYMYMC